MKPTSDERRETHLKWIDSLDEARNQCRMALMQGTVDVSDPERALWPAVGREEMTREHRTVARAHASILDYVEHLEPYKNRCADLWTADIMEPYEFPDGSTLDVALSEIEEWADQLYEDTEIEAGELNPRKRTTTVKRVHLPEKYARETFRQANKCIERLKLGAEIENRRAGVADQDGGL